MAQLNRPAKAPDKGDIDETVRLVTSYVKQQTLGPLKGVGRKAGFGIGGALALGFGVFFVALGLLRLIQAKVPSISEGAWSWVSYLIVFAFCVAMCGLAVWRIRKIEKELN